LPAPSTQGFTQNDDSTITTLAHETDTEHAAVKYLYDEEIAALQGTASVKNFIGIIAARRVKQRLAAAKQTQDSAAAPGERRQQDQHTVKDRATQRSRAA